MAEGKNKKESQSTRSSRCRRLGDEQAPTTKEVDCPGYLHANDPRVSNRSQERTHHHQRTPALSASDKASILGKEPAEDPALITTQPDTIDVTEKESSPTAPIQQRHKYSEQKSNTTASSSAEEKAKTRTKSPSSRKKRSSRPNDASRSPSRRKHRTRDHKGGENEVMKHRRTQEVLNKTEKAPSSSHGATNGSSSTTDEARKSSSHRRNRKEEQRHDPKKSTRSSKLAPISETSSPRRSSVPIQSDPVEKSPSRRNTGTRTRKSSRTHQDHKEDHIKSEPMLSALETPNESSFEETQKPTAAETDELEQGLPFETMLGAFINELKEGYQMPMMSPTAEPSISSKQSPNQTTSKKPETTIKDYQKPSNRSQLALGNSENDKIGESMAFRNLKIHHETENGSPDQKHKESLSSRHLPLQDYNGGRSVERTHRSNPLEKFIDDNNAKAYGGFTAELKDSERSAARRSSSHSVVHRSKSGCDIAAAASSLRGQLQRSKSLILRRQLSEKRISEGSIWKGADGDKSKSPALRYDQLMPVSENGSKTQESSGNRPKVRQMKVRRRKSLLNLGKVKEAELDRNQKVRVRDVPPKSPSTRRRRLESRIRRTSHGRASDDASITPKLREETIKFALEW